MRREARDGYHRVDHAAPAEGPRITARCHHCHTPLKGPDVLARITTTPRTLIRRDGTVHRFATQTVHPYCPDCEAMA